MARSCPGDSNKSGQRQPTDLLEHPESGAKGIRTPDLLHAMQVKPIAGCGCMGLYQQLQSLYAAGDGLVSPPACSPSCSPTSTCRRPAPAARDLVGCYRPTARTRSYSPCTPRAGWLIRLAADERGGDHAMAVDLVRCR